MATVGQSKKIAIRRIAVIPGDGIGPEVTREAVKTSSAAAEMTGARLEFNEFDWGAEKYLREGVTLPPDALPMLRAYLCGDAWFDGPQWNAASSVPVGISRT